MKRHILIGLLTLLTTIATAHALGVTPAATTIEGDVGDNQTFQFRIFSDSDAAVDVQLSDEDRQYIDVQEETIAVGPDTTGYVTGKVTIPPRREELKVSVIETVNNEGQIKTSVSTPHYLYIDSTRQGQYLDYGYKHTQEPNQNGTSQFALDNIGTEPITDLTLTVTSNAFQNVTKTVDRLPSETFKRVTLKTPELPRGMHTLKHTASYANTTKQGTQQIQVGQPTLDLNSLYLDYQANETNLIKATFDTKWNQAVTETIQMRIKNDTTTYDSYTAPNTRLDGQDEAEFLFNDSTIPEGNHTLIFTSSTDTTRFTFNKGNQIKIQDDGESVITGEVTNQQDAYWKDSLLIILSLLVLTLLSYVLYQQRQQSS